MALVCRFASTIAYSFDSLAVLMNRISVGSNTVSFCTVRAYVWLSQIWHSTASDVDRLTNARPTVGEMPRDSLIAQTMSWDRMLVAVVARAVRGLPVRVVPVVVPG